MPEHTPSPVESFVQQADLRIDNTPPVAIDRDNPPCVLEAIEDGPVLRDDPTAVVCPGCNTEVHTYATGLPERLVQFREHCPTCELELRRWSVVALPGPVRPSISTAQLAKITQAYWERDIWAGATTSGHPRNAEFTSAYTERAAAYGWDWTVRCPLCRRSVQELTADRLEYHHWTRPPQPDRGVCLCRHCHDAVNGAQRDAEVDWRARELGLGGQHHLQIARLAARELLVEAYTALGPLAGTLIERYNVPYDHEYVARIITQAFTSDVVRDALVDQTLHAGVVADA